MNSDSQDNPQGNQKRPEPAHVGGEWGVPLLDDSKDIFEYRFRLSWEHFKFHAEQRTKMFHFFLISAALILSAYSWIVRATEHSYTEWAFIPLAVGGLMSTFFLSLDVRNTQLLEYSENILRGLEESTLFRREHGVYRILNGDPDLSVTPGIFAREACLKEYAKSKNFPCWRRYSRWIAIDNIKHKLSIRGIEIVSIIGFWWASWQTTPDELRIPLPFFDISAVTFVGTFGIACVLWMIYALFTPRQHIHWERQAYKWKRETREAQN